MLTLQSPRPEWAKEPDNNDDTHCEKNPQKWLKLKCRMLCCIQQLMIKYDARLGSFIRIFLEPPVPAV